MPHFKRLGRLFFLRGICSTVFDAVQFMEFGLKPETTRQTQAENGYQQSACEALGDAPKIKPFHQKMNQRNAPAPMLQNKKPLNDQLCSRSVIGRRKQGFHFRGEECRAGEEREEHAGAKPNRRIGDAQKSQETDHAPSVRVRGIFTSFRCKKGLPWANAAPAGRHPGSRAQQKRTGDSGGHDRANENIGVVPNGHAPIGVLCDKINEPVVVVIG